MQMYRLEDDFSRNNDDDAVAKVQCGAGSKAGTCDCALEYCYNL